MSTAMGPRGKSWWLALARRRCQRSLAARDSRFFLEPPALGEQGDSQTPPGRLHKWATLGSPGNKSTQKITTARLYQKQPLVFKWSYQLSINYQEKHKKPDWYTSSKPPNNSLIELYMLPTYLSPTRASQTILGSKVCKSLQVRLANRLRILTLIVIKQYDHNHNHIQYSPIIIKSAGIKSLRYINFFIISGLLVLPASISRVWTSWSRPSYRPIEN